MSYDYAPDEFDDDDYDYGLDEFDDDDDYYGPGEFDDDDDDYGPDEFDDDESDEIRDEIQNIAERGWAVSLDEWKQLKMNSHEREFLLPYVDNSVLVHLAGQCLNNIFPPPKITYEGFLLVSLLPEILKRLLGETES